MSNIHHIENNVGFKSRPILFPRTVALCRIATLLNWAMALLVVVGS